MTHDSVTVAVIRKVRAGREAEFEAALHEFIERSLHEPGQLGVHVIRPPDDSDLREYGILRRFANVAARDSFYGSDLLREWNEKVSSMTEGEPRYEHLSGLETWFTFSGSRSIVPPPRWKMALVTFVGVYPVSLLLHATVGVWLARWPLMAKSLITSASFVLLLTWLVMPKLTGLFRPWLYPDSRKS